MIILTQQELNREDLKKILNYDPISGIFIWKISLNRRIKVGVIAGCKKDEYIVITINRKLQYAHRLAWLWVYGEFPKEDLDHINQNKSNNRIQNLRLATKSENNANKSKQINNTSGYKGVSWVKRDKKWRAYIRYQSKFMNLGYFSNKEEAAKAYNEAALKYFGEFAYLNKISYIG